MTTPRTPARTLAGLLAAGVTAALLASQSATATTGTVATTAAAPTGVSAVPARGVHARTAAASSSCADVLVVGARGSGETMKDVHGLGTRVGWLVRKLREDLAGRRTVEEKVLDVKDYPAEPVSTLIHDKLTLRNDYLAGLAKGVRSAHDFLTRRDAQGVCPDQRIVLAGYSQGAMVMHRLVVQLQAEGRTSILGRIAGVALLADGDRVRDSQTEWLVGSPPAGKHGIGVEAAIGGYHKDITGTVAKRTWAVCTDNDLVCDFRLNWFDLTLARKLPLIEIARIKQAVLDAGKAHTGQTYRSGEVLKNVAQHIADEARITPKPTDGQSFAVTAGVPVSYQLTADVNPSYDLQWRLDPLSSLPAGLSMSSGGLITGTPTTGGEGLATVQVRSVILGVVSSHWITTQVAITQSLITNSFLLQGFVGVPYEDQLTTISGAEGSWSLQSGSLPDGLELSSSGRLSGTPTEVTESHPTIRFTTIQGKANYKEFELDVVEENGASLPTYQLQPRTFGVAVFPDHLPVFGYGTFVDELTWQTVDGHLPAGMQLSVEREAGQPAQWAISGTPSEIGDFHVTLRATDSLGHWATTSLGLLVSPQPVASDYSLAPNGIVRFSAYRAVGDGEHITVTRFDSEVNRREVVSDSIDIPEACSSSTWFRVGPTTPDGRYIVLACEDKALFRVDVTDGIPIRVDDPDPTLQRPSNFRVRAFGISDDGSVIGLRSDSALTADTVTKDANVIDHLYVKNVSSQTLSVVPSGSQVPEHWVRNNWYLSNGTAELSSDGAQVTVEASQSSAGGSLFDQYLFSYASPGESSGVCPSGCVVGYSSSFDHLMLAGYSVSSDGMRIVQTIVSQRGHYGEYARVTNVSSRQSVMIQYTATDAYDNIWGDMTALISPNGDRVYYTTDRDGWICALHQVDYDGTALSNDIVVGDPPEGLPRTGCSWPSAVTDSGELLLVYSTNSNLIPGEIPLESETGTYYGAFYTLPVLTTGD